MAPADRVREEIAYDRLGQYLKALSNPLRLEMLFKLRFPKRPADIQIAPRRADSRYNADRVMSRQSVSEHLSVLEAIGVVTRLPSDGPGDDYVTNHQRVFAIVEEMRKLTLIRPTAAIGTQATMDAPDAAPPEWEKGPKLVLVGGSEEGRTFPLDGDGPWTVGRGESAHVRLDYDPFVSAENAHVQVESGRFVLRSLPDARNGTHVNFRPLAAGEAHPLRPGDVVGVGRSLMVFQPE